MAIKPFVFRFQIERVKDGDTIYGEIDVGLGQTVKYQSIRLFECWCPEKNKPGGPEATAFTEAWCAAAGMLIVDSLKFNPMRSFERIIGVIYRDEDPVSLNQALLLAGHATRERPA